MNRRKYVSPLTPPARERLLDHEGDGGKARRHRLKAQAIRLSAKGLAISGIASVCEQSRGTISRWIDRRESSSPGAPVAAAPPSSSRSRPRRSWAGPGRNREASGACASGWSANSGFV